jgi:hypothetical protein
MIQKRLNEIAIRDTARLVIAELLLSRESDGLFEHFSLIRQIHFVS